MKYVLLVCLVLCVTHAAKAIRHTDASLVQHLLTNGRQVCVIDDSVLYLYSKNPVDTANVIECAGIAGCDKVVFVRNGKQITKKVK